MYICILALFFGWFSSVKASPDFQIIIEFEDIISRETILKNLTMIVEDIHETNPKEIIELLKQRFLSIEEEKDRDRIRVGYDQILNYESLALTNNINNLKEIIGIFLKALRFPKDETEEAFFQLPSDEQKILQKTLNLFEKLDKLKELN